MSAEALQQTRDAYRARIVAEQAERNRRADRRHFGATEGRHGTALPVPTGAPVADGFAALHARPAVPELEWSDVNKHGRPLGTIPNLAALLQHYGASARLNVISKRPEIIIPGASFATEGFESGMREVLHSLAVKNHLPVTNLDGMAYALAASNPRNPVHEWITSKPWDGRDRSEEFLLTIDTAPGFDRGLLRELLQAWLVSAVAAVAMPEGFSTRGVLVFQGAQSIGKTQWFRSLVPDELRDTIKTGARIDPDSKDTVLSALSHWLVELGELDSTFRRADIASLKAFVSESFDMIRRPYGRTEDRMPRRTVFFASVNPESFLHDDTGSARWWAVPVTSLNWNHSIDMQQLWAQVLVWYSRGVSWHLTPDAQARLANSNRQHEAIGSITERIRTSYSDVPAHVYRRNISATDVLLELGYDRPSQRDLQEAGKALREVCGEPRRTSATRVYAVPMLDWRAPPL